MNSVLRRRRALMVKQGGSTPILPAEYQQVEWIGSSGTQYIVTGINPSQNEMNGIKITAIITFPATQTSSPQALFGFSNAGGFCIQRGSDSNKIGPNPTIEVSTNTPIASETEWTASGCTTTVGSDSSQRNYGTIPYNRKLHIMSYGDLAGTTSLTKAISSYGRFTVEKNGSTLFDGIPCYRKSDGVIGLYDLVSESFKTNSGTGSFTKGADV